VSREERHSTSPRGRASPPARPGAPLAGARHARAILSRPAGPRRMRLTDFIRANREPILVEWEAFARTCTPASTSMDVLALRDHAEAMLLVIAEDLATAQGSLAQSEKSKGRAPEDESAGPTAAEHHGTGRAQKRVHRGADGGGSWCSGRGRSLWGGGGGGGEGGGVGVGGGGGEGGEGGRWWGGGGGGGEGGGGGGGGVGRGRVGGRGRGGGVGVGGGAPGKGVGGGGRGGGGVGGGGRWVGRGGCRGG
jgi:hypothetical protein